MKFDFFKKKGCKTGSDCECGCTREARESVRLTDAEIAEDILGELNELEKEYSCLCGEGCDCSEKLQEQRVPLRIRKKLPLRKIRKKTNILNPNKKSRTELCRSALFA